MKMLLFDFRESEEKYFKNHIIQDCDITFYKESLNENTILSEKELEETQIISVFISSQLTEKVINKFKNLRIIATRSTGYNHIDTNACIERNIAVVNVDGYGKRSVAQYTISIMVGLIRYFVPAMKDFQQDNIQFSKYTGYDLAEMTLGVIGTGAIGAAVCEIANFFGMHIFAYDCKINNEIKNFVEYVSLEDLYKYSNIISLHIPLIPDVYHMISHKEFEMMNDGVYIINTSRGELIDNIALYDAIKSKKVAGAALDVLECENLNMYPDDFISNIKEATCDCISSAIVNQKLFNEPNVIITPHIAYNTYQAVNTILDQTFKNIKSCISGKCSNRIV